MYNVAEKYEKLRYDRFVEVHFCSICSLDFRRGSRSQRDADGITRHQIQHGKQREDRQHNDENRQPDALGKIEQHCTQTRKNRLAA